jgi:hypothetical protein
MSAPKGKYVAQTHPDDYRSHLADARRFALYAMQSAAPGKEHMHIKMAQTSLDNARWCLDRLRRSGKMKKKARS